MRRAVERAGPGAGPGAELGRRLLSVLAAAAAAAAGAAAQDPPEPLEPPEGYEPLEQLPRKELRDFPYNDPRQCPHTYGDPWRLEELGFVSTGGGFPFGAADTDAVEELLPTARILWGETEHFRIGFALGEYRVKGDERSKIGDELWEMMPVLPELSLRARSLDPWLRLYLTGRRMEKVYDRFLEIARVEDGDFPASSGQYATGGKYMGLGPYVGMRDKFEILILSSEPQHTAFLIENFGLPMSHTQRWHVIERGVLTVTTHIQQDGLRDDEALHAHLAFNVGQNLLDGYKYYAYNLPVWLREGFSHLMEREVSKDFNSFDGGEGVAPMVSRKSDWAEEVAEMILKGDAPRLSELLRLKSFGDMSTDDHYATWSMQRFLVDEHGDGFACILDRLSSLMDESGYLDGGGMPRHHREAFRDCLGMSYAEFDEAWRRWATGTEEEEEEEAEGA